MEEQLGMTRGMIARARMVVAAFFAIGALFAAAGTPAQAAAPANDNFASAQVLAGQPVSVSGTTRQATRQNGEPDHAESQTGPSVWYRWTPSVSGAATIGTCDDGDYVGAVAVYTGSALSGLVEIGSGYCRTVFEVTAGTEYRIAVASYSDWTGPFGLALDVHSPPANDLFADAVQITGSQVSGTTLGATREPGEPEHGEYYPGMSVWYSWTPSQSGTAVIETCDEEDEDVTLVAAYSGGSVDQLTPLDRGYCRTAFRVVSGSTYRIAVATTNWPIPFDMTVQVIPAPANDDFGSAVTITGSSMSGTTVGATSQAGEPEHGESGATSTVWYSWTAPQSGTAIFDTCDGEDYSVEAIAAYTGSEIGSLDQIDAGYCEVSFPVTSGTTYRIALASYPGWWGPFTLNVNVAAPPANDNFGSSTAVTALPINGTTLGATSQTGEPDHDESGATATVWYRLALTQTATYRLNACGDDDYIVGAIAVYSGTAVDNLTRRASGGCEVLAKFAANTTYRVAVASYPGAWGDFSVKVTRINPPTNNDFAAAKNVTGDGLYESGHTYSATRETGEPVHHPGTAGEGSVWYSWTPSNTGDAYVEVCGEFDSVVAAYTGASLTGLQKVASDDDSFGEYCDWDSSALQMRVTAGTTYKIAIDGKGENDLGFFDLFADVYPDPVLHELTVDKIGTGTGTVAAETDPETLTCGSTCSYQYAHGSVVQLHATPDQGSSFIGWAGACSGSGTCQVTLDDARTVIATFADDTPPSARHRLTVNATGDGSGSVSGVPGATDCRATCSSDLDEGTRVTLQAKPDAGSTFAGWTGACAGTGACVIDLVADSQVGARFDPVVVPPADPDLTLAVATKKLKLRAGKTGKIKLSFGNAGGLPATGVKLCLTVPAKFRKTVKPARCVSRAEIKPGTYTTTALAVKTTAKAKGSFNLKVSLSATNGESRSANVAVAVAPKKKRR